MICWPVSQLQLLIPTMYYQESYCALLWLAKHCKHWMAANFSVITLKSCMDMNKHSLSYCFTQCVHVYVTFTLLMTLKHVIIASAVTRLLVLNLIIKIYFPLATRWSISSTRVGHARHIVNRLTKSPTLIAGKNHPHSKA